MDTTKTAALVADLWRDDILPTLTEYITIPCKSPAFDPDWAAHGEIERAVRLAHDWVAARLPAGCRLEIRRLAGRTPILLAEVPGDRPGTVLLYGHLDKQPEFEGWRPHLGPWNPVRDGDKLYGRGGADDGYAVFASTAAVLALKAQGVPHPRLVMLIELSEESGSPDLEAHVDAAQDVIGRPDLVVCLDSGAGDYERLWNTTSLRGNLVGTLSVDVLTAGVHSGDASGVVPSSFRVIRALLDRLEDSATGRLLLPELHADIPAIRRRQAAKAAAVLGEQIFQAYPWAAGMGPATDDPTEALLARTWAPTLSVTGVGGMPPLAQAGNVLRPRTELKLSLRLPPTTDPTRAAAAVKAALEADPPYGARVRYEATEPARGWEAPPSAPWLDEAVDAASRAFFGHGACSRGEGGTIPFMGMLGEKFPDARFLITGVLGPASNAHGPNEFLHLPTAERLTSAVAHVIAAMP